MELFHVLNRGVDKRKIYLEDKDYFRFIHDLYEFNDKKKVLNVGWNFRQNIDVGRQYDKRELLVDIHAFCLMPNHYHLLLSPKVENGIPLFMKKVNGGFAKYFNLKYERTGTLFERRYKSVAVVSDGHLVRLPYYIHLNPLDLDSPEWRESKIANPSKAINFLENYRWSSFLDYIGKKNFPSVINKSFLKGVIGDVDNYKKETLEWVNKMDYPEIDNVFLE